MMSKLKIDFLLDEENHRFRIECNHKCLMEGVYHSAFVCILPKLLRKAGVSVTEIDCIL